MQLSLRLAGATRLFSAVVLCAAVMSFGAPAVTAAAPYLRSLPLPPLAAGGLVNSSSCVKGPVCVSIGWNHHGQSGYTWVARWQDGRWTALPTPRVSGGTISCATATWCMVTSTVGEIGPGDHPVSEVLVGTRWIVHAVPSVKGSTDLSLYELNCRSSTWCIAVGAYVASKPNFTDATFLVSEVWNGSTWRIVPIYSPRTYAHQVDPGMVAGGEHPTASPQQISCTSRSFCVIAGFWRGVFVEQWNGHRWNEVAAPNEPKRQAGDSEFSGGTCASTTFCVAAGGYEISNGVWRPLIDQWDDVRWRTVALPKMPSELARGNGFRLTRVACTSSIDCVAFGDPVFLLGSLNALEWNGKAWTYGSMMASPKDPSIVCLSKKICASTD